MFSEFGTAVDLDESLKKETGRTNHHSNMKINEIPAIYISFWNHVILKVFSGA